MKTLVKIIVVTLAAFAANHFYGADPIEMDVRHHTCYDIPQCPQPHDEYQSYALVTGNLSQARGSESNHNLKTGNIYSKSHYLSDKERQLSNSYHGCLEYSLPCLHAEGYLLFLHTLII